MIAGRSITAMTFMVPPQWGHAFAFTSGVFAELALDLAIMPGDRDATSYSDILTLYQTGSQNLVLTPASPSFTVSASD